MSRFRFDISGAVFVEEKDFFGALMADPSGAMTDRMREALKNTNAEDLFGDGYNGWNLGSDEALTITVTDTETGAALIYNSDETWRPYQHNQPADAGHVRVLSAQVNENGEQSVTRIVGELSIEDFRTALGEGFQLRLVTPVEAAAPDLLALAERIEAWEARLVLEGEWGDGLPRFTQSLYDEWMELQALRNAAIAKAKGESA